MLTPLSSEHPPRPPQRAHMSRRDVTLSSNFVVVGFIPPVCPRLHGILDHVRGRKRHVRLLRRARTNTSHPPSPGAYP